MKKLLNTLFVISEDSYLALENENVVIWAGEERKAQYPLSILESIVTFSYKGASPALMGACVRQGVHLSFMTPNGRFLARVSGENNGNVLLRRQQYRLADDLHESCKLARNAIFGKIYNDRWIIERMLRDHPLRVNEQQLRSASQQLADALPIIAEETSLDTLRGLEGEASQRYFGVFDQLILNQKEDFHFASRSRRPPLDRVNAMLSFVYTLLANDCASALESVGLDAYVGFMHRDRPGRASLALDLMEELRGVMADRMVIALINTKAIQAKHFQRQPDGAILMTDEGRKLILNAWQTRKKEQISHPYLKEKIAWGLVPYVQALLLARTIRNDLDAYPPFLWK